MTSYFEKSCANGRVEVMVDGRWVNVVFFGNDGQRIERHKRVATSHDVLALLEAGETDEFNIGSLADWDDGPADADSSANPT